MGLKVYRTATYHTAVHATPDCPRLRNSAQRKPVVELDLSDLQAPWLCSLCFPGQPKSPKVFHARCLVCRQQHPRPCPHNGAVQVYVTQRRGAVNHYSSRTLTQVRWVWPENAWAYTLVAKEVSDASRE